MRGLYLVLQYITALRANKHTWIYIDYIYMSADCLILLKQTRIADVYLGKLPHGTSKADTTTVPDSTAFLLSLFELPCIIILYDPEGKIHRQDRSSRGLSRRYLNLTSTSTSRVSRLKRMSGAQNISSLGCGRDSQWCLPSTYSLRDPIHPTTNNNN